MHYAERRLNQEHLVTGDADDLEDRMDRELDENGNDDYYEEFS
jgi:hypothetical protein